MPTRQNTTQNNPHGKLGVVIGDVSGHGVPAALLIASTRRVIRTLADFVREPGDLIAAASKQICEDTRYEKFVEIFLAVIDLESRNASYIGAGHSGVLLKKNGDAVTLGGGLIEASCNFCETQAPSDDITIVLARCMV